MDTNHLSELLDRYWRCETSVDEEHTLRTFFAQPDIPAEWQPYRPWFTRHESPATLDSRFDARILTAIGARTEPQQPQRTFLRRHRYFLRVAAVLVIAFGTALFFYRQHSRTGYRTAPALAAENTFDNPQEALAAVRCMLSYTSEKMNYGIETTAAQLQKTTPVFNILKTN